MLTVWLGFFALIAVLLMLDLGVFHRRAHAPTLAGAIGWTAVWILLALAFNAGVYFIYEGDWLGRGPDHRYSASGHQAALEFFTAYIVEKSLSVDNIFVIAMVFAYFHVPVEFQHRVLFWGIFGAIVLRGVMIAIGVVLIERFDWIVYVFGGLLILSAVKMLVVRHDNIAPEHNPLIRLTRRLMPVTHEFAGARFFVRRAGRMTATPLLLALLLVESSDVLFAIDSIPAVFAVTSDPFLVFTSNIFAILGLRSLYFVLAGAMEKFRFMKLSLVFLLAYVGVKMLLAHHYPIPTPVSLAIIGGILAVGVVASLIASRRDSARLEAPPKRRAHAQNVPSAPES